MGCQHALGVCWGGSWILIRMTTTAIPTGADVHELLASRLAAGGWTVRGRLARGLLGASHL